MMDKTSKIKIKDKRQKKQDTRLACGDRHPAPGKDTRLHDCTIASLRQGYG